MGNRRCHNDTAIWTEKDRFVGICLGWDFTSEHEWGIKDLQQTFGLKTDKLGVQRMKVHCVPENLHLQHKGKDTFLFLYTGYSDNPEPYVRDGFHYRTHADSPQKNLVCGWCESSFIIRTKDAQIKKYLQELYDAFQKKNAVVYLGSQSNPFGNAGLNLCILNRLPQTFLDKAKEVDQDYQNLKKAAEKTGIETKLKEAGKKWYALSPKWKNDDKQEVIFWLNPQEQKRNNSGWFTVEDLEQWIANEGPVPQET